MVAVEGERSFYVNGPAGRYEDVVTRDAVAYVEKTFRVVPGREGRALFGVSMGGYAALRIALSHPEIFRAAATHSAMLLERPPTADQGAGRGQMAAFQRVFGDPIDPRLWAENDPLELARKADPAALPPSTSTSARPTATAWPRATVSCTSGSASAGSPTRSASTPATTGTSTSSPWWKTACASWAGRSRARNRSETEPSGPGAALADECLSDPPRSEEVRYPDQRSYHILPKTFRVLRVVGG